LTNVINNDIIYNIRRLIDMLTYILLSIMMVVFKPEIGEFIASSMGVSGSGFYVWLVGLLIAFFLD
jgi:hypothetical protein